MTVRIGINGFGRIGRYILRVASKREDVEVVAINSRAETSTLAHLFEYDSVHGRFNGEVKYEGDDIIIDGKKVKVVRVTDELSKIPWGDLGVSVVMECTGKFRDGKSVSGHLEAGAKKVIIGAPAKNIDGTFVYGVNHLSYDPAKHNIISNASCTTNCLAPLVKVIHEKFGIQKGLMTTVHSYTMDQRLLDGSHKDLRRARAAALSMVPTTTGAAVAVTEVIPELRGKMDGIAIRVPTPNVSLVDFVAQISKDVTISEINEVLIEASQTSLKGILACSDKPLVSVDFTSTPYSSIVDLPSTNVIGGNFIKVLSWYDNEAGFSNRMVDLAVYIGNKI